MYGFALPARSAARRPAAVSRRRFLRVDCWPCHKVSQIVNPVCSTISPRLHNISRITPTFFLRQETAPYLPRCVLCGNAEDGNAAASSSPSMENAFSYSSSVPRQSTGQVQYRGRAPGCQACQPLHRHVKLPLPPNPFCHQQGMKRSSWGSLVFLFLQVLARDDSSRYLSSS